MKKVIIVTDLLSGQRWCYRQVEAMIDHIENPVEITTTRQLRNLRKENPKNTKYKWLVKHSGCRIECHPVWSREDVENDNPTKITM